MTMKRVGAWLASVLLLVAIVASGAHAHHAPNGSSDTCVACTLAHAPAADDSATPAPVAPQRTGEVAREAPISSAASPLVAGPSSRAPPA